MTSTKQVAILCAFSLAGLIRVAPAQQINQQRRLITQPVNNSQMVTFSGNTRPEASSDNDQVHLVPTGGSFRVDIRKVAHATGRVVAPAHPA